MNKPWGKTEILFEKNNVSIHRLEVDEGGCCSLHFHQAKFNVFYVESGSILINPFGKILTKGELFEISPGIEHQFKALEKTVVFEIYFVTLNNEDIIRIKT